MLLNIAVIVFIAHELIKILFADKMLKMGQLVSETAQSDDLGEKQEVYFGLMGNPIIAASIFLKISLDVFSVALLFSEYWIIGVILLLIRVLFSNKKEKSLKKLIANSSFVIIVLSMILLYK